MPKGKKPKGKPRGKPMAKGFDARRKILTQDDRRRGFANAPRKIQCRVRGLYKGGKIKRTGETVWDEYSTYEEPY